MKVGNTDSNPEFYRQLPTFLPSRLYSSGRITVTHSHALFKGANVLAGPLRKSGSIG
jgi:hypothetical protein